MILMDFSHFSFVNWKYRTIERFFNPNPPKEVRNTSTRLNFSLSNVKLRHEHNNSHVNRLLASLPPPFAFHSNELSSLNYVWFIKIPNHQPRRLIQIPFRVCLDFFSPIEWKSKSEKNRNEIPSFFCFVYFGKQRKKKNFKQQKNWKVFFSLPGRKSLEN